jgi:hypothetical protein
VEFVEDFGFGSGGAQFTTMLSRLHKGDIKIHLSPYIYIYMYREWTLGSYECVVDGEAQRIHSIGGQRALWSAKKDRGVEVNCRRY